MNKTNKLNKISYKSLFMLTFGTPPNANYDYLTSEIQNETFNLN